MSLRGKTVLVTGASGFIGGRLVEKLILHHGASVRVLVRNYHRAIRLARFDVDFRFADITNPEEMRDAAAGCDVIFHCAFGSSGPPEERRAATVDGTQNVCEAARQAGVSRLVYLSTLSVYGDLDGGTLDESSARQHNGQLYTDTKIDAEQVVARAHETHGLPTVILQPTVVYGPFGGWWTQGQINQLKGGRLALPNAGEGVCNAVYVDDVVDVCLRAAEHPDAVGETFLVSGPEPVSWNEYYAGFEAMLGRECVVHLSPEEMRRCRAESKEPQTLLGWAYRALQGRPDLVQRIADSWLGPLYRLLTKVLPATGADPAKSESCESGQAVDDRPIVVLDEAGLRQYASTTRVSTDKLRRVLSYEPRYDLDRGMRLTGQWARWAGLLDR